MNGKLAAVSLTSADTATSVYRCRHTVASMVSIAVCNRSTAEAEITISIGSTANTIDIGSVIEFKTDLLAKNVLERTGVAVSSGEYITIESTQADVSVVVMGTEMGTFDTNIAALFAPTQEYVLTNMVITFQLGNIQFVVNDYVTDIKSDLYADGLRTVTLEISYVSLGSPSNTVTLTGLLQDVGSDVHYFTIDATGATVDGVAYASSPVYAIGEVSTGGTGTVTFNA